MATCVSLGEGGALTVVPVPIEQCQGYALVQASEYANVATLSKIFTVPASTEMAGYFSLAFTLPCTLYLVGHAVGRIVSMFNSD